MLAIKPGHQLRAIRSAGGTASAFASWTNVASAADVPDSARVTVGDTDTTLVPSPAASTQNVVGHLSVFCETGTVTITVTAYDGTLSSPVYECVLRARQSLTYTKGMWIKAAADGTPLTRADSPNFTPSVRRATSVHARASISTLIAGSEVSFWRGTGFPAQGAVPAAAAACNNTTTGAFPLASRTGAQVRRLLELSIQAATASQTFFLEDRLAHMGGLSGTVATAQTIGIDLQTLAGTNNIAARKGAADWSDVEWFMEWYTATGSTSVTPVINVTYDDGSTGNANVWVLGAAAIPASVAASRRYQILPAVARRSIRGLNNVTMPTTGTAGSFGFTAVRKVARVTSPPIAFREEKLVFDKASAPVIEDEACLTFAGQVTATSSGVFQGGLVQDVSES